MTRIVGDPECPICHATSDRDDAFFPEYVDGLHIDRVRSLFHPPAFHWGCYYNWPGRDSFAGGLFTRHLAKCMRSTLEGRAYCDDDIGVFVWVCEPMTISLILRETGRMISVSQEDWISWQSLPDSIAPECQVRERIFLRNVLPRAWFTFPNKSSFESKTDWSGTERHLYADV